MQSSEILADIFISTRMRAALEAVPFEIEAEEPGLSPPCPLRYQLAFMQPEQILCLQFRNYYVATVRRANSFIYYNVGNSCRISLGRVAGNARGTGT
eukprot:SAG31_NODE_4906_length_2875_cov_1.441282_1_plen_97_part_00